MSSLVELYSKSTGIAVVCCELLPRRIDSLCSSKHIDRRCVQYLVSMVEEHYYCRAAHLGMISQHKRPALPACEVSDMLQYGVSHICCSGSVCAVR